MKRSIGLRGGFVMAVPVTGIHVFAARQDVDAHGRHGLSQSLS
jgi:hypothetical protein